MGQKIIVLDFEKGEVFVYNFDKQTDTEQSILEEFEHKESHSQWMIVNNLKININ